GWYNAREDTGGGSTMKASIAVLAALTLPLVWATASAHTGLRKATPESGSTVAEAPKEIVLEFSGPVRLTTVSLASAAGKKVEMGALPTATEQRFALSIDGALASGDYVVTWRAVGADTHVVSGELKFSVAAAKSNAAGATGVEQKDSLPDTAAAKSGVSTPR